MADINRNNQIQYRPDGIKLGMDTQLVHYSNVLTPVKRKRSMSEKKYQSL